MSDPSSRAHPRTATVVFAAVVGFASVLAVIVPELAPWGDGLRVVGAFADPERAPLFVEHLSFGPLAHAAIRAAALFGLDAERALGLLTRAGFVCGSGLAAAAAVRAGARAVTAVGWGCVAAAAPGVLLLQGVVEYHGVQFLSASFALWLIAPSLATPSVTRGPKLDAARAVGAAFVAFVGHGSHVVLVAPLLLVPIALRVSTRSLLSVLAAATVLVPAIACLVTGAFGRALVDGIDAEPSTDMGPIGYAMRVLQLRADLGWFRPVEVAQYLWHEWIAMQALLLVGLVVLLRRPLSRTDPALLFALVAYAMVVPQFGVRERGAYFLGLVPWIVVVAARSARLLPWAALVVQLALGLTAVNGDARRADARAWLVGFEDRLAPPLVIYTTQMVRHSVVPFVPGQIEAVTLPLRFDPVPRRSWGVLVERLEQELSDRMARGNVYLDADLFRQDDDAAPWQAFLREHLAKRGFRTVPVQRRPVDRRLGERTIDTAAGPDSGAETAVLMLLER